MAQLSPLLKQATPVQAARGEGVYLYDTDGRRHLDFTAGIGVTSTGHCHPTVVKAAQEQVGTLIHGQYTTVMHQPLLKLVERMGEVLPEGIDSVFFTNSGSEAVEASVRLARQATGRSTIVAFDGGFHGRTMGAAALTTSGAKIRAGIGPMMGGVAFSPFPYAYRYGWSEEDTVAFALRELDRVLASSAPASDVAAFIVEPVLGEGGYVPTPSAFLHGLRERADKHGILLIADEVQTGYGRTGRFWGHQHAEGFTPDVIVTAKGLASGFPLSAIAAPKAIMEKAWPGSQGGTYGGNAVACAAALATLDVVQGEGLVENARVQGEKLVAGVRDAAQGIAAIGDVRGRGLMVGIEFVDAAGNPDGATAAKVHAAAAAQGLLLLTCGVQGNIVRMIPPLVVTGEQIDEGLALWTKALDDALS
ncbi:Gamma-aminobutyrate:alpha-ketoglutarate aminotransferase [Pseudonocardia sp. Ae168_Ps1]|uniref:aspartate aminotransferase family protein n=1 Tax=unclassified Pseudonocardia TaxID=2619320 RepID=UPI0006CB11C8|nr:MULTISPECIES: aminotransferase class III-fold pyridoxal phosphate-dependent enzyme [unclassified Pseudonocardia]ALE74914.1 4-aminobutyrate aminotransferase [Pseudonocardia sp. EC080625-04]ALL74251.1 4-aminobutyrate aminotransferase [Pseudonocardia sp. EC080610-09]ALL81274.1 4-aminobutyrate aminotransferase [Pseudonocardia sp. EC080619-01]OLL75790.1 Gamma-aminobutyrate:alpha-ketoglutarate aminotransferase [Pseudonocardia sp. Ae150A_Ps1]OLL81790.1 Gamma-aminobutyrate:alpha-ketoglutarate amino